MDQSTPCAQVMDKHRSGDTSSQAALRRLQLIPDFTLPPSPPKSLEQLSASVSAAETQRHPQHPAAFPANTFVTQTNTQAPASCLLSKHPSHTQVIDFYSSRNLLPVGWTEESKSIFTHRHLQAHLHTRAQIHKQTDIVCLESRHHFA